VSHQGAFKSLEAALRTKGFAATIYQSREVLEIDKLSKYFELCDDLIRLSRQPSTRPLCQGLKIEVLQSYPGSKPLGSPTRCYVHGEVQLVLLYEQYPKNPPPRAIGSSKSACFLCDLFITQHGGFGISHSHMKLYPIWTIPEVSWMTTQQVANFRSIIERMTLDIQALLKKKLYHCNAVVESRAHILQIAQRSETASSLASPAISEPQLGDNTRILVPKGGSDPSTAISTLYYCQDLPITLKILPSTISCTLLVGKVDYIFDLEEIEAGQLRVSECTGADIVPGGMRVNVRSLSSSSHYLKNGATSHNVTFHVHDAENHELRVSMTWNQLSA
jgi:hypothetical protein